ncbi:reverse transcriptase [compost metagenome]
MKAEYRKGYRQRDSVERKGYAGARSIEAREGRERDGATDLMERILNRDNLNRAYKQVKRNHGAPGIDGMTVEAALPWLRENRDEFLQSIRKGSYKHLNEFDQEMERRGVRVIRYADDIVVLAKSRRAALRLLESSQTYLEKKLKLQMNTQKSKVVSVVAQKHFKFLGFALGKNGKGVYVRVHRQSLAKAKKKLKELTRRVKAEMLGK